LAALKLGCVGERAAIELRGAGSGVGAAEGDAYDPTGDEHYDASAR